MWPGKLLGSLRGGLVEELRQGEGEEEQFPSKRIGH